MIVLRVLTLLAASLVTGLHAQGTTTSSTSSIPVPTPFEHLPPPPIFADGGFTNPNTTFTQIFTEGSKINITWETTYQAINLFFGVAGRGGYAFPITVTTGQSQPWIEYTLQCRDNNCTLPHRLRAVNTYGTEQEHLSGGFTSGEFWIAPVNSAVSSSSAVSSTASSTSTSSSAPSSTTSESGSGGSSTNATAVGVGVGVGVGGAVLAIGGVLMFWLRKRKRRQGDDVQRHEKGDDGKSPDTNQQEEIHESDNRQVYEAYAKPVHEASTNVDPSELPGSSPR